MKTIAEIRDEIQDLESQMRRIVGEWEGHQIWIAELEAHEINDYIK